MLKSLAHTRDAEPDISYLTEAHGDSLDGFGAHANSTVGVVWPKIGETKRKVLPWSPGKCLPRIESYTKHGSVMGGRTPV